VDLAAERGGNCELTQAGEVIVAEGVTLCGKINLGSSVPYHASMMYARNISSFLLHLVKQGKVELRREDEIIRSTLLTHAGEIVNERVREFLSLPALANQGTA
jgi:NAD(P) transhydrogenase subunit alpha